MTTPKPTTDAITNPAPSSDLSGTPEDVDRNPSKGSLVVIFLTVFIDLLGFGIVLPLLPLYGDQFGTDTSGFTIGMLMACFSMMQFIFAPIWGSVSDRIGRRPVIMMGLTCSVVFYTLFGIATIYQSLPGLFAARIFAGIACATVSTAQAYIADTTSKQNRARGMALIGMAFGMGFTLGPLFAYFAVPTGEGNPGPWPGFIAAILSGVALLLAIFLLPESLSDESQKSHRKWFDGGAWRAALSSQALSFLLIGFFTCLFAFSAFETTLSMLINGSKSFDEAPFNFSFRKVCLTFAFMGFLVALIQGGIVRRLAKRIPEQKLAIAGAVLEVIGFAALSWAVGLGSERGLYAALVVIVGGYSCLQPSLYSLLSRWSDPNQQGKVLGVGQSVSALARISGSALGIPMLVAYLYLPYIVASVSMFLVAAAVLIAARTGKDYAAT